MGKVLQFKPQQPGLRLFLAQMRRHVVNAAIHWQCTWSIPMAFSNVSRAAACAAFTAGRDNALE